VLTADIDEDYQRLVESMMGCVHGNTSNLFRGTDPGETRFVACSSTEVDSTKSVIRFGFQFKPNLTGIVLADGEITVDHNGHELLWAYFEEEIVAPNPNNQGMIPRPRFIYAAQVFRFANLNQLFA
jgi:hypothetical protein